MKRFDENNDFNSPAANDSLQDNCFVTRPSSLLHEKVPIAEAWTSLCAKAAVEQDPKKLLDLVIEINRLLDARRKRLLNKTDGTESK